MNPTRRLATTVMALASVAALALTPVIGSAQAESSYNPSNDPCPWETACLWIHGADDPRTTGRNLQITVPGGVPDWTGDLATSRMRSLPSEFVDVVSVGANRLTRYDLCLYDSNTKTGEGWPHVWNFFNTSPFVVPPGGSFAQMDDLNDRFDAYMTAKPGTCPKQVHWNWETGSILDVTDGQS